MSELFISNHPLVQHKLSILRDKNTNNVQFRALVEELGTLLCYEATRDLPLRERHIETPLTSMTASELSENLALVPILRAGLGMVGGIWKLIPQARVLHVGLYRNEETHEPVEYYNKLEKYPVIKNCLILDPMLATGGSAIAAVDVLKRWGAEHIRFVGLIAAPEGVEALQKAHPDVDIFVAALDDHLNENCYIVPGLGDAGDRQFGTD